MLERAAIVICICLLRVLWTNQCILLLPHTCVCCLCVVVVFGCSILDIYIVFSCVLVYLDVGNTMGYITLRV